MTQGKRVDYLPGDTYGDGDEYPFPRLKAGEYGKDKDGLWHCIPPGTDLLGSLGEGSGLPGKGHKVVEHEDGTITVSPSILIRAGRAGQSWHGYLERGVWREC